MSDTPTTLGRYELVELLARGGMGELWRARLPGAAGWEKDVAVKTILPHLVDDEAFVDRFVDEARIAVTLSHGNIVPVFDMGVEDGRYFIAMEYVRGADLRRLLRTLRASGARVPDPYALYIAAEIARGLDYAHSREDDAGEPLHIVHRDVSPSNILISREGDVKLADFGIASARSRMSKTLTGELKGKLSYMSPEQATGQSVDPRSDLYALGVVLYEMLAGQRAFDGSNDMELLARVQRGEHTPLGELRPDLEPDIVGVVERAMAMDPADRYASAEAFQVDVQRLLYRETGPITQRQLAEWARRVVPLSQPPATAPAGLDTLLNQQLDGGSAPRASSAPRGSRPGSIPGSPRGSAPRSAPGGAGHPAPVAHTVTRAAPRRRRGTRHEWLAVVGAFAVIAGLFWYVVRPEPPTLEVTSSPDAATVYVDGREVGITTLRLEMEPGSHEVHVVREGFNPIEWRVDLMAGDVSTLHAQLEPVPVLVTFDSLPDGATVTIADAPSFVSGNAVPMHVGLPTRVRMELEGYAPLDTRVNIQPGQSRWVGRLEPLAVPAPDGDAGPTDTTAVVARPPQHDRIGAPDRAPPASDVGANTRPDRAPDRNLAAAADAGPDRPGASGTLSLNFPVAPMVGELVVDGVSRGLYDPFGADHALELPVGEHRIVVTNADAGTRFETVVQLSEGAAVTVPVTWEPSGAN